MKVIEFQPNHSCPKYKNYAPHLLDHTNTGKNNTTHRNFSIDGIVFSTKKEISPVRAKGKTSQPQEV
jgi:hypothetical protein